MKEFNLTGLATGIGSLPFIDAAQAVEAVNRFLPHIPFWPQLPKRHPSEGMLVQYSEGMPCLRPSGSSIVFDASHKDEELESFYQKIISNDIASFAISPQVAAGLYEFKRALGKATSANYRAIKCHITGPCTFAAGIKDEKGVSLLHDPVFMQAITSGLRMKILWQLQMFKDYGPVIVFIDEPYLGCFGSAYTPVSKEDVVGYLTEVTDGIDGSESVIIGVHCCGNTDWSLFTDIPGISMINFDAFGYLDTFVLYAHDIARFLSRGGYLCWGVVPTQEELADTPVSALIERLRTGVQILERKGVPQKLLLNRMLISPSCGLGTVSGSSALKVLQLLHDTSQSLREQPVL